MKIIGIDGSPRPNGNTEKLVRKILEGAASAGGDAAYYKIAGQGITPCQGCTECRSTGVCTVEDGMQELYGQIRTAEALVLGTPIYMGQMAAQTKMFIDRLVVFLRPDFSVRLKPGKRMALAVTQGNPDPGMFKSYIELTTRMISFLGFDIRSTLVANGTRAMDDILAKPDLLDQAFEAGKTLVS